MTRPVSVRACIRCGSADLRMGGIRDGIFVGTGDEIARWACNACGLTAVPLLFDSEADRARYAADKAKHPDHDWPPTGWPATTFGER